MGIRKGIFIGAAAVSIMACTACGNSGGNVSGTNGAETSTGVESGYARLERSPEEAAVEEQDETKSAEKENEIEGNSEMADNMDDAMEENYGEYGFGEDGEFDFDSIFGIDQLDLNYEAHVAGFDGESFLYEENYMGYIDIYKGEDQIMIYLDLGGVSEEDSNVAVTGVLKALNSVSGIKSVIINEEM